MHASNRTSPAGPAPAAQARAVACGLAVQRLGLPIAEAARAPWLSASAVPLGLARIPELMRTGGVRPGDLVPRVP